MNNKSKNLQSSKEKEAQKNSFVDTIYLSNTNNNENQPKSQEKEIKNYYYTRYNIKGRFIRL